MNDVPLWYLWLSCLFCTLAGTGMGYLCGRKDGWLKHNYSRIADEYERGEITLLSQNAGERDE